MADRVRYGFLGASQIIRNQHGRAFAEAENAEVVAIASRRPEKARRYADDLAIPRVHETYDALLADDGVDAVLITLPMSLHCEWIVKAAAAGKHVLCEKPLVLSVDEAERVIDAADRNGVKVLEAFTHIYQDQIDHVSALIADGRIGDLRAVRAEVLYPTQDWDHDTRADVSLGGRVLIEAGCYCVHTIRRFMGDEPTGFAGFAAHRGGGALQTTFAGVMRFGEDRLGYLCTSMETAARMCCDVIGTAGRIDMPDLFNGTHIRVCPTGKPAEEIRFESHNRFRVQVERFSQCILDDADPPITLADSLNNIRALCALNDAAYR